jgi:hypothetical protein
VSEENSNESSKGQQKKEDGVDVLDSMVVTAAVFQLERFALKAVAPENAVGAVVVWTQQSKKNKIGKQQWW